MMTFPVTFGAPQYESTAIAWKRAAWTCCYNHSGMSFNEMNKLMTMFILSKVKQQASECPEIHPFAPKHSKRYLSPMFQQIEFTEFFNQSRPYHLCSIVQEYVFWSQMTALCDWYLIFTLWVEWEITENSWWKSLHLMLCLSRRRKNKIVYPWGP